MRGRSIAVTLFVFLSGSLIAQSVRRSGVTPSFSDSARESSIPTRLPLVDQPITGVVRTRIERLTPMDLTRRWTKEAGSVTPGACCVGSGVLDTLT